MLFSSTYRTSSNIGLNFVFEKGSYTPEFTISTYCQLWFVVLFIRFFYNLHLCIRNSEHSLWHWYPYTSHLWKLLDHDQFFRHASFSHYSFIRFYSVFAELFFLQIFWCLLLNIVWLWSYTYQSNLSQF